MGHGFRVFPPPNPARRRDATPPSRSPSCASPRAAKARAAGGQRTDGVARRKCCSDMGCSVLRWELVGNAHEKWWLRVVHHV